MSEQTTNLTGYGPLPVEEQAGILAVYFTTACGEYVAEGQHTGGWSIDDQHYDLADEDDGTGPVELVRRSDGARFEIDVSVAVWPKAGDSR